MLWLGEMQQEIREKQRPLCHYNCSDIQQLLMTTRQQVA